MVCKLANKVLFMNKILVVCLAFISYSSEWPCKVKAKRVLSEKELQLRSQLKVLNKPPIQSFKRRDGSIIDCIDIYKQPAFDHPLLKNHKLQERPSAQLRALYRGGKRISEPQSQDPECPTGTVPIRRTRKRDLINAEKALSHFRSMAHGPNFDRPEGSHFAVVGTKIDSTQLYVGANVDIAVYNLTMLIPTQTSAVSFRLGKGNEGPFSSIEYGYTFNNQLYGDTKARTFSLWTADGFQKTGCFNMLCPGFVQVHKKRIMGDVITEFTRYGSTDQEFMIYTIMKDGKSLNWWLLENVRSSEDRSIGYWPEELFPDMIDFATDVQLGGKVFDPSDEPAKTPMGTGHFVEDNLSVTAQIRFIWNSLYLYLEAPEMDVAADAPHCYNAQFLEPDIVLHGGPDFTGSVN